MIYQPQDRAIYDDLSRSVLENSKRARPLSEVILDVGRYFLGSPYTEHTLERQGGEALIINLRSFDCFTFVENVIALAGTIQKGNAHFRNYAAQLKKIRYRHGILKGYTSRLHYFSDWLYDNERKGIVRNVTRMSYGERLRKNFNFMTTHRAEYPALQVEKSYREMITVEKRLSRRILYYIPKAVLGRFEKLIENGDLLAITADVEGLDVMHVGFALCLGDRVHLLHSSETDRRVVVSDLTLRQYLLRRRVMTGIIVGRAKPACQNDDSLSSA